jgi:hypothetical protein
MRTSASEGIKLGTQQAFGEMLVEFFAAVFDEISDWSKIGRTETMLLKELKTRLHKVAQRCEMKLKAAQAAFRGGLMSGFFSNLVTALINTFITTGRRMIKMLREGVLSIVRGIEMLLLPPKGISIPEAAHEASKILLAGGMVVGAIPVEEWLEKQLVLIPVLSGTIATAITGALTAVVTVFGVYFLDKADLFGVIRNSRHADTIALLDASIADKEQRLQALLL